MKTKSLIILFVATDLTILFYLLYSRAIPAQLHPAGQIAAAEQQLIVLFLTIAFLIVIPLFSAFFLIVYRYRDTKKASYRPDGIHNRTWEITIWAIPSMIILLLSILMWHKTHTLDPYRPLESKVTPLVIQVVALRWKWLFIYPEQHIATVNFVQFPKDTPITFQLTADQAPMNSFWIPRLGGQMYAMTGMSTPLHLQADHLGDYEGSAAEISGIGFSGMRFTARASSREDFTHWVEAVRKSGDNLDEKTYAKLLKPSEKNPVVLYSLPDKDLYNTIIQRYMGPGEEHMEGMGHH